MKKEIEKIIQKYMPAGTVAEVAASERLEFGHYSTPVAMRLAKILKKNPMEIARDLAEKIRAAAPKNFLEKIEAAPPGFVNFWLAPAALQREIQEIVKKGSTYGKQKIKSPKKVQVEYVSANPTGPLTLANSRGGFLGHALSNVLAAAGNKVEREFYVNDTGNQIITFGKSVLAAAGIIPEEEKFYKGQYVKEWAAAHKTLLPKYKNRPLELGRRAAADFLKKIQKALGGKGKITFDRFTSEHDDIRGKKLDQKALGLLKKKNVVYENEGAVWLRTTGFGDDKDRVLITSDGFPTYFLADAGHYLETVQRGFDVKINILGPDHYGYVARIQAAAQLVGMKESKVIVTQTVRLIENGEEVKMGKRKGRFIQFEELIDEVGTDVARFFFLMITPDSHMDFDMDLAREHSNKNPVYYAQYAYTRAVSILKKIKRPAAARNPSSKILAALSTPEDAQLMLALSQLPDMIAATAVDYQVHRLARYALDVAKAFHNFYEKEHVAGEEKTRMLARAALVDATRVVLGNLFALLGISAPEKM